MRAGGCDLLVGDQLVASGSEYASAACQTVVPNVSERAVRFRRNNNIAAVLVRAAQPHVAPRRIDRQIDHARALHSHSASFPVQFRFLPPQRVILCSARCEHLSHESVSRVVVSVPKQIHARCRRLRWWSGAAASVATLALLTITNKRRAGG